MDLQLLDDKTEQDEHGAVSTIPEIKVTQHGDNENTNVGESNNVDPTDFLDIFLDIRKDIVERMNKMDAKLDVIISSQETKQVAHKSDNSLGLWPLKNPAITRGRSGTDPLPSRRSSYTAPDVGLTMFGLVETEKEHIKVLQYCFPNLKSDLNPDDIEDELISQNVLSISDVESVKGKKKRSDKVRELIAILCEKPPEHYRDFVESLKPSYGHLVVDLEKARQQIRTRHETTTMCARCLLAAETNLQIIVDKLFTVGAISSKSFRDLSSRSMPSVQKWDVLYQLISEDYRGLRGAFLSVIQEINNKAYRLFSSYSSMEFLVCRCMEISDTADGSYLPREENKISVIEWMNKRQSTSVSQSLGSDVSSHKQKDNAVTSSLEENSSKQEAKNDELFLSVSSNATAATPVPPSGGEHENTGKKLAKKFNSIKAKVSGRMGWMKDTFFQNM